LREHFSGGYLDSAGKIVIPAQFSQVEKFFDGIAVVKLVSDESDPEQPHVLINRSGEVLSEKFTNYRIHDRSPNIALKFKSGWYICSRAGSPKYGPFERCDALVGNAAFVFGSGRLSILENGREVKKLKGIQYVIPCSQGDLLLARTTSRTGVITSKGDWVISPVFTEVSDFSDGLAVAKLPPSRTVGKNACSSRVCYVAQDGKIPFSRLFCQADKFIDGYAAVSVFTGSKGRRWGVINRNGEQVIPTKYKTISIWTDGIANLHLDDCTEQLYDCRTSTFGIKANRILALGEQMYAVQLAPNASSWLLQRGWKELSTIQPNVVVNGFCGRFDEPADGSSLVPFFTEAGEVRKFGWLDRFGIVRIPFEYSGAGEFSQGLAAFYVQDKK